MAESQPQVSVLAVGPSGQDSIAAALTREDNPFEVLTAADADEGLATLAEQAVDCVVSEADLPDGDGVAFLERVRETYPDLPFILVGDRRDQVVDSRAITAGVTEYLHLDDQPWRSAQLADSIATAVNVAADGLAVSERDRVSESDRYRERLLWITSDPSLSAEEKTRRLLALGCERLGLANGHLVKIDEQRGRHEVVSVFGSEVVEQGVTDLSETYCRRTIESSGIVDVYDATEQGWVDDPAYRAFGLESYVGRKLLVDGHLYGTLCFASDRPREAPFTEQERAFLDLLGRWFTEMLGQRRELKQAETVFQNAQDAIFLVDVTEDREFTLERVNRSYEVLTGLSTADVRGKTPREIVGEEAGAAIEERYRECVERRERIEYDERLTIDGTTRHWHTNVTPVVEDDTVVKLVGATRDVTERQRRRDAIEALHETVGDLMNAETREAVAEVVVRAVQDVIGFPLNTVWFHDAEAAVLRPAAWTDRALEVVGDPPVFERGESLSWDAFETGTARYYADVSKEQGRHSEATPVRSEVILPLGDHGVINVASTEVDAFDEQDRSLVRTVAAHAETVLDRLDREAKLREERAFIDQALDTLEEIFYVVTADGEMARWNERLSAVTGYSDDDIAEMDPIEFFAESSRERIATAIEETLTSGEASVEAELETADGEQIPYRLSGRRLTDADGESTGLVGVGRDISRRRERERELREQNERLDEFAGIVSHDLRNPLNVAMGHLAAVRDERDDDHLETVARAHDRMAAMIDDLLVLAREGERDLDPEPVDLAGVTADCWSSIDADAATLSAEADQTVRADRSSLRRLLSNLLRNAVEHGGDGVTVRVGDLEDGFYVEDDGPGVPPAERDRIFESGHSTARDGTGFGLSIVTASPTLTAGRST